MAPDLTLMNLSACIKKIYRYCYRYKFVSFVLFSPLCSFPFFPFLSFFLFNFIDVRFAIRFFDYFSLCLWLSVCLFLRTFKTLLKSKLKKF